MSKRGYKIRNQEGLHFVVCAKAFHSLSDVLRDLKNYTSVKIISEIRRNVKEIRKKWMMSIFRDRGKINNLKPLSNQGLFK